MIGPMELIIVLFGMGLIFGIPIVVIIVVVMLLKKAGESTNQLSQRVESLECRLREMENKENQPPSA
ncbi:hypothetical protein GF373_01870 [bacterium]|nr:hypothetical protein [bacterium]